MSASGRSELCDPMAQVTQTKLHKQLFALHCKEMSIYVFPEKELRGLSHNFRIYVSVSDLYIPTIGPTIFLQQNRQTNRGKISLTEHECRNWD
jgi:hypothetical protein